MFWGKNNIFFIIILIVLSGCVSSKKYYSRGDYARAVQKSVNKIQKGRRLKKEVPILVKAYPKANQKNVDRIMFLKQQGTPDIWDEVFEHYSILKARQNLVKTVTPLKHNNQSVDFPTINYDADIIEAKNRASEYFYAHSKKLLQQNDKESARQAFQELNRIKSYFNSYKDADSLMRIAKTKGTTRVVTDIRNNSNTSLPNDFLNNLINFSVNDFNSIWVQYDNNYNDNVNYDFCVNLNIKGIGVSPEKINEVHYTQSMQIQDGWEYELDRNGNGNVKKDSLGNDIKRPKNITISCNVTEMHMQKAVHIDATVDYLNLSNNNIVLSKPIFADQYFDYTFATAFGDIRALTPETKKIVGLPPQNFPTDINMIYSAGDIIKKLTIDVMHDNKYYLK